MTEDNKKSVPATLRTRLVQNGLLALAAWLPLFVGTTTRAQPFGDGNFDGAIDTNDVAPFSACISGPATPPGANCWSYDFDLDVDVDLNDIRQFQLQFGSVAAAPTRLMGLWSGSGRTADGPGQKPFDLVLAQRGHQIYGIGWYTVDAGDLFNGSPAVRLVGAVNDNEMLLGASGRLDNLCIGNAFLQCDNAVLDVSYNPGNGRLTVTNVVDYLPVGCDRIVETFVLTRDDEPHVAGNHGILGTWLGEVATPPGWFFAPIPSYHPRKSFVLEPELTGYMEIAPGVNWAEMFLEWDPGTAHAVYTWLCLLEFRYDGVIDGNKFSGFLKWSDEPDEDFFGVFCHTLQDELVPPDSIAQCP